MESAFRELTDEASPGHWKDNMGLLGPTWWALKNYIEQPWLVWLSESSAGCQSMGLQFGSQSGHMPGLQARSPVGDAQEATTH